MVNREADPTRIPTLRVAGIVVFDTITRESGDEQKLREALEILEGENGSELTQFIIEGYTGTVLEPPKDQRVIDIGALNIGADGLRADMIQILKTYLEYPESERAAYAEMLTSPDFHTTNK